MSRRTSSSEVIFLICAFLLECCKAKTLGGVRVNTVGRVGAVTTVQLPDPVGSMALVGGTVTYSRVFDGQERGDRLLMVLFHHGRYVQFLCARNTYH